MSNHETVAMLCLKGNAILIDAAANPRTAQALIDCAAHLRTLETLLSVMETTQSRPWSALQNERALHRACEVFANYWRCESLIMLMHGDIGGRDG